MTLGSLTAKSKTRFVVQYSVLSDSADASIPKGSTLIKGSIDVVGDTAVVQSGIVANYGLTHKTDVVNGEYELLIPASDSILFFYSEEFGEIITQPYDFKVGHVVILDFYPQDYGLFYPAMDKPVIYCYSDQPLTATINLNIHGDLTFTYPKYDSGWTVDVNQSGQLETNEGKSYPYLFWEGKADDLDFKTNNDGSLDGFYLKTDSIVDFLEEQLNSIGLNRTEQTDFITYWSPRILENDFAFIQFLVDDEYARNVAEIAITPKPDQLKRVYILFSAVDKMPDFQINPQTFKQLERNGFTLVEWGGSELILNQIQL